MLRGKDLNLEGISGVALIRMGSLPYESREGTSKNNPLQKGKMQSLVEDKRSFILGGRRERPGFMHSHQLFLVLRQKSLQRKKP